MCWLDTWLALTGAIQFLNWIAAAVGAMMAGVGDINMS